MLQNAASGLKIGMTLAIWKISGKIPLWDDLLINLAKADAMMSFNCFIIFVSILLGPMLLLAFRSEIRSFTSCTVVCVLKKVKLFRFFKKLEKCFLVGKMFFCNCLPILVKILLKCSAICFWSVIVLPSWIRDESKFILFLVLEQVVSFIPIYKAL